MEWTNIGGISIMADMERIEKALEGNGLALSAVAEVLHKMDARFAKADEDEEEKRQDEEDAVEKAALVKELATAVASVLKADQGMDVDGSKERKAKTTGGTSAKADEDEEEKRQDEEDAVEKAALVKELAMAVADVLKADQGMDVDGTKERKAKTTGGSASRSDDSESAANITSKIEDQQAVIQAMRKGDDDKDDDDDYVDEEKANTPNDDEDVPEDEEATKAYSKAGDDDEDEDDEMKSMQKELDSLRKQLADVQGNLEKAVQTESENRLRKMGFREETGLVAPKQTHPLGTDGTTPIVKSTTSNETVDQLVDLSYGELRRLQQRIQIGDTDGIPRELLN